MKKTILLCCLMAMALGVWGKGYIRINYLGYLPQSVKVAVLMSEEPIDCHAFELVNALTGKTAATLKAVTGKGRYGHMASTYRLDFSTFTTPGSYYIRAGKLQSPIFPITARAYDGTADFVLRYMRQQRCGWNPYYRDSCHTHDALIVNHPTKSGQWLDVRGGWHDASDCLQYTTTTANAIYQMMLAYQQNPKAFTDQHQADGTRGKNGIPDIVDEIYWGLDWLNRMNPAEGELYNQLADDRDHVGMRLPHDDQADYGWGKGGYRPVYFIDGKPQQRGRKSKNATMGAASTAGKFASCFALGSTLLKSFYPAFADSIGRKAEAAYEVGVRMPGNCQTVSVLSPYIYEETNWVDDMELGAIELYNKTGNRQFLQQAVEYGRQEPITPWMGADSARHYQWYPFMNMGHYRLAVEDPQVRDEFLGNLRTGIERVARRGAADPFLFGVPGIWCSNNLTTALLTQCILYRQLSDDRSFEEQEAALRDWLFGCNPWGVSMVCDLPLSGISPQQPHSCLTYLNKGTTTGGLVDGPVYATIFHSLRGVNIDDDNHGRATNYLDVQPSRLVYHDNMHDYSTNEPTMDGTASLTFPLSAYQEEGARQEAPTLKDAVTYEGGIVQANPKEKKVYLVFTANDTDDGAQTIIRTLKETHTPASFFFTGLFFETFPKDIKRLLADGHYVGSHSYGHLLYCNTERHDSVLIPQATFNKDLQKSYQLMARFGITPEKAPYFMPPYETYNATISAWAKAIGLQVVNFTSGTGINADYMTPDMPHYRSSQALYDRLMDYEAKHGLNGYFLLIHLGTNPARTDKLYNLLPQLITELTHRGYSFGRL